MLNFAYGSNMLLARIRERTPSAKYIGTATLRGYQLCWHKPGAADLSGKCDIIVSAPDSCVYGVLYDITDEEWPALDAAEGGYEPRNIDVGYHGKSVRARAYFARTRDSTLTPYSWYKALVVAGAKAAHLPDFYVAQLEAVTATLDPDLARHESNMALATGGSIVV